MGENVTRVSGNNVRKAKDYGNAVLDIGCLKERHIVRGR
jgi:hypothetical protein